MRQIRCGRLFDPGRREFSDATVLLVGPDGRIVERLPADRVAPGPEEVDLSDAWVLPGLVDAHDHFGIDRGDGEVEAGQDIQWRVLKGVKNARAMLASGITTVRSAGEKHYLGQHVRRAIDAGWIDGPRSVLSGEPICSTGGHGCSLGIEADGPDAVRTAVRTNFKRGADMIKMIITAGTTTRTGPLARPCFGRDEIDAAVAEVELHGGRIGVHCYGGDAATWAIDAGVTSIEHGTYLTDGQLDMMAARGIFLVSTSSVMGAASADPNVRPFMRQRFDEVRRAYVGLLTRARVRGVRVAVGCDTNHASMADEVRTLLDAGYQPGDALAVATSAGAALCGLEPDVGSLDPGRYADLVAVNGTVGTDPVGALRHPTAVFVGGVRQLTERSFGPDRTPADPESVSIGEPRTDDGTGGLPVHR